jgi:phosphoglycolate phosphatase-like HAD superfamily hydrolase
MNEKRSAALRRFKAVFFDLDGTLVDIHGPLYAAARTAIELLGVASPLTREKYDAALKQGEIWLGVPAEARRDYMQLAYAYFLTEADHMERLEVLPHAVDVLANLKQQGYATGVVTSRPGEPRTLIAKLAMVGLARYLDIVITQREASLDALDKSSSLRQAAVRAAAMPSACIYVGDEPRDTMAARKAGFGAIFAVATGPASFERLRDHEQFRPDCVMRSLAELPAMLEWMCKGGGQ